MSSIGTIKCPSSTFIRQLVHKKEIFNDCGRVNRKDKRYGCVLQFIKKKQVSGEGWGSRLKIKNVP